MSYQLANVLVTGAAGFIGSSFVHELQRDGHRGQIVTVDRLSTGGDERNLLHLRRPELHTFVRADVCDLRLMSELMRKHRIDTIVHFAAETHVDRSIADPAAFFESNVTGTLRLLQAASEYWLDTRDSPAMRNGRLEDSVRFHQVSTDEVYGSLAATEAPFTENARYDPRSPYAASKAAADHLVRAWHNTYGLPVTLSISSNNFGERQHREKLLPTVVRSCLTNTPIPVYGDGRQRRDWIYKSDHCDGIKSVIANGEIGQSYHLAGGIELANHEMIEHICRIMDQRSPGPQPHATLVSHVADRPGHDRRYALDTTRTERELGWTPQIPFEAATVATCCWYLANPDYLGLSAH